MILGPVDICVIGCKMSRTGHNHSKFSSNILDIILKFAVIVADSLIFRFDNPNVNRPPKAVNEVLHDIRDGLCFSGTTRLEKTFEILRVKVELNDDLEEISALFSLAYQEVRYFEEAFEKMKYRPSEK